MKLSSADIINSFYSRYPALIVCKGSIDKAIELLAGIFRSGGKLLTCGNGGSAADSSHIVGELMKGFVLGRGIEDEFAERLEAEICGKLQGTLRAISLPDQNAVISAYANDVSPELVYAQLTYGYGDEGDALLCLSTSGNSKNVVNACKVAKAKKMISIAMTGEKESELSKICDVTIRVPETETYKVQEYHLPVYHLICLVLENEFFC